MPKVEIQNQTVAVGHKSVPLLSGEVHYWRLNPDRWGTILQKVKASGMSVVATYVPWEYHEYEKGRFDFTGSTEPRRNLLGFLELTRKMGFWLIIRPGPYIYSEWPQDGVPLYAHKYHRLHPQFLAWAEDYVRVVTEVIRPYMASEPGGHIILLQADNEIDPWPDRFGAQYGLGRKPGMFQEFLRKKYGGRIARLNKRWRTQYRGFGEAGPFMARMVDLNADAPRGYPLKGDPELKRNLDYFEFKHHYAARYARKVVAMYRRLKIKVPIYLNTYPFFYAHDWRALGKECDFIGIDVYAHNEFKEHQADHRKTLDKFRYTAEISRMAYVAEFGCGVWHPQHYKSGAMTPNHYRMITVSALMGGITGWNWYMFVNRDNWYMSPVNEWGETRGELFSVFSDLIGAYKKMEPYRARRLCDVGATYNTMQYAAKTVPLEGTALAALYDADIDYRLFDPAADNMDTQVLFYSGNQWISRKAHRRLRSYVRNGGTLIAFQEWPRKDENFEPVSTIGFEEPRSNLFEFRKTLHLRLGRETIDAQSTVFRFEPKRAHRIMADVDCGYGALCVGYIKKVGRGRLIHLGIAPSRAVIHAILRYLKTPLYVFAETPGVRTSLFRRGRKVFLAVVHNGREDKSAYVRIPYLKGKRKKYRIENLFSGKMEASFFGSEPAVSFSMNRKDGQLYEII